MNTVKFEYQIEQDEDAPNPRKEFDNFGKMVCWHKRYDLGDEQPREGADEWLRNFAMACEPDFEAKLDRISERGDKKYAHMGYLEGGKLICRELDEAARAVVEKHCVILPLYLYDHSGITMSTSRFSCPWDSGQVGYIYATREMIQKEYGWKNLTKARRDKIETYLEGEVETYDQYLTGDAYGYIVERVEYGEDGEEVERGEVDSVWGFYGSDYCEQEAKSIVAWYEAEEPKLQAKAAEAERIAAERLTFPVDAVGI